MASKGRRVGYMSRNNIGNNPSGIGCVIVIMIVACIWCKWSDYTEARYQRSLEGRAAARERQLDEGAWISYNCVTHSEFETIERVGEDMQHQHGYVIWTTLSSPPEINITTTRRYYGEFVKAVPAAGVDLKSEAVFEGDSSVEWYPP